MPAKAKSNTAVNTKKMAMITKETPLGWLLSCAPRRDMVLSIHGRTSEMVVLALQYWYGIANTAAGDGTSRRHSARGPYRSGLSCGAPPEKSHPAFALVRPGNKRSNKDLDRCRTGYSQT